MLSETRRFCPNEAVLPGAIICADSMSEDPAAFLPAHILSALKRKASRDPASRFSTKLHLLLTYSHSRPDLQNTIGCAWVNDDQFRIHKKTLCAVMGIKLNTLNINLNVLHFEQHKSDHSGWTLWSKPGFTRESMDGDAIVPSPVNGPRRPSVFNLGMSGRDVCEKFTNLAARTWMEMMPDVPIEAVCPAHRLIEAVAARFKQSEQPMSNAYEVMSVILAPKGQAVLTFTQFGKLLAMFGPEQTIMIKIASLLTCSNGTGKWLSFEPSERYSGVTGRFDESEPNCLVIQRRNQGALRAWNMPLVSASEKYVVDEHGKLYESWDEFFKWNPVHEDQSL